MPESVGVRSPRYVLVSADHQPSHGGIGTYVRHLVPALVASGWEVHLLTRPGPAVPSIAHLHEIRTPDTEPAFHPRVAPLRAIERIRPYRAGLWALAVAERLLTLPFEPDVIEFVDSRAEGVVGLRSRRVRERFPRTPMVVSAHTPMFVLETLNDADPARFGRARSHAWERAALAAADGVIAPSRALRDRLALRTPTLITPHPFDVPPAPDGDLPGAGEEILVAASLQPAKGVEEWACSLNDVLRARPRAVAHVVGPDTPTAPGGGSMSEHLRTCLEPSLRSRLRRHGARPASFVASLMDVAALVVVPSRFESFSFVAAEALLRGRNVLVTEAVGLREHAPALPAVPACDAAALASAQRERLADPAGAHREATDARRQLADACVPATVIATRTRFIETLTPAAGAVDPDAPDALDEMRSFLAETERLERDAALPAGEVPS